MRPWNVLVAASLVVAAGSARADINTGSIDVSPPWIQAIVNGDRLPATAYALHGEHDASIDAHELRDTPIAIAIVYQTQEIWVGNDDFEVDDAAKYLGALKGLAAAVDSSAMAKAGPAGSKIVLVTYSTGAELHLAPSDLVGLTGRALGAQQDFKGRIGTDLVQGLTLALDQLASLSTPRKALIVVGDGNDTNNELAMPALTELRERAHAERVDTFSIIYKSPVSSEGAAISKFVTNTVTVSNLAAIGTQFESIIHRLNDGYAVLFDGRKLDWDGKSHHLAVFGGDRQLVSAAVILPVWDPPSSPWSAPWRWFVIALGVAAVAALGIVLRSRLRAPV